MSTTRFSIGALALIALVCVVQSSRATVPGPAQPALVTGGTVSLELTSTSNGQTVAPFQEVFWRINGYVSSGDNQGLALISVDFVQDASNPELFDIPAAAAVTNAMRSFDRPDGFTNPGSNPKESGYGGAPIGPKGRKNRLQIGGAQNTFGRVGPCLGPAGDVCMGQDVNVDVGIGQDVRGETIAFGSFRAPATPGTYKFRIRNGLANTLETVHPAPQASTTQPARILYIEDEWTFTVQ